jgi:transposase-like protein
MKRKAKKAVSYSESYKQYIVYAVMRDGFSIASICTQFGIDEPYMVREWVREFMKKRGLVRIPRTLTKRGNAPKVIFSEAVNHQFRRYEEIILYHTCLIESMFKVADEETKKKLLSMLTPAQQRNLKRKGKLSI